MVTITQGVYCHGIPGFPGKVMEFENGHEIMEKSLKFEIGHGKPSKNG